jgi:hypothetical protein
MRSVTSRPFSFSGLQLICPERLEPEGRCKKRGAAVPGFAAASDAPWDSSRGLGCGRSCRSAEHDSLATGLLDLLDG